MWRASKRSIWRAWQLRRRISPRKPSLEALAEAQERAFTVLLSQVKQHITITPVLPPALPAPQPVRAIGFAAPKHEAVTPQTLDPVSTVRYGYVKESCIMHETLHHA